MKNLLNSKKNFLQHILKAKEFGADLVKIQTYEPQDMVVKKNFYIKSGLWKGKNLWKLYKQACTPFSWHEDAFKLAKKNKINLFSSPFSLRALNFLKKFWEKIGSKVTINFQNAGKKVINATKIKIEKLNK